MTPDPRGPTQTILAADAAHPCLCVRHHRPVVAEFERHHLHPAAIARAQGLVVPKLTADNEWSAGPDHLEDEQRSVWVLLCGTSHSSVHVLLRRYAALGGTAQPDDHGFNRYALAVAFEGNRRVMLHGGWGKGTIYVA